MNEEYQKSIQDIAWKITTFAERDFESESDEVLDRIGGDVDLMITFLEERPEKKLDWDNLEEMSKVVCDKHNVEYQTLVNDVWSEIMKVESVRIQNNVPYSSDSINTN